METLSRLENANFTHEQARAIIAVLDDRQRNLATKSDVDSAVNSAKIELKAEILQAKYEVVKWIVGALIFNVGLVFALIKLFGDK